MPSERNRGIGDGGEKAFETSEKKKAYDSLN